MDGPALLKIACEGRRDGASFIQFIKFLAVGLLNTALGYGIYAALSLAGFGATSALALTYAIAVPMNFLTTGKLVFDSSRLQPLLHFLFSYAVVFSINWGALWLLMTLGLGQLLSQALLVPFMAVLSFLLFKHFVFESPECQKN
jgi:putative flippase GtrA